jgi:hypothetical protein
MDLRSICVCVHQKVMSTIGIRKDIEATLGPDAIGYFPATACLREAQVTHDSGPTPTLNEDECQRVIDKAILLALAEERFASVRRIASKRVIPRTIVYGHLIGPLGMTAMHLHWLPHRVPTQQKCSRVQRVQELLGIPRSARHSSGKHIISLNKSLFLCTQTLNRCGSPEMRHAKLESTT